MPSRPSDRALVTAAMLAGMFLAAIDTTAVSTAMPAVVEALGGLQWYAWVFSVYVLASTATMPLFGALSDVHGRKPLYLVGVGLFVGGSVLCSTSDGMLQLVAYRALQGIGAGAVVPITMTIIGDIYDLERRARMQGLFSGVWGLSAIFGPLLGGLLVDLWSWRAIFWLNVPFGMLAAILVVAYLRESKERTQRSLHLSALASLTVGIGLLLVVLQEGGRSFGWLSPAALGGMVAAGIALVAFVLLDRRSAHPVLPPVLLRNRIFATSAAAGVLAGATLFGIVAYLPLYVQGARGGSATLAGSSLVPLTLGWVTSAVIAGRVLLRIGYRKVTLTGLLLLVAGTFMLSRLTVDTSLLRVAAELAVCGVGLGMSMTTMLIAVQNGVPRAQLGTATAAVPFTRNLGGAVGVAVMGALLLQHLDVASTQQVTAGGGDLVAGTRLAFTAAFLFAVAALAAGTGMPGGRAQELVHREEDPAPL